MKIYKLTKSYTEFISSLLKKEKEVIAPQIINNTLLFAKVEKAEKVLQPEQYINTVRSAKEFIFPQTEPVVEFKFKGKDINVVDTLPKVEEKIIIGLRPCDASAFPVLDDIFNYEYKDEFYLNRRRNTTLIGVACEKSDASCFCTSVGIRPDTMNGSDIFFKKNKGGNIIAYVNSTKGEELVKLFPEMFEEILEVVEENPVYNQTAKNIREPLELEKIKEWLDKNFDDPRWDEYAARCLGCASCAYLCPTCHCFDIIDENKYDVGLRRKNWDACQFPIFTVHASGHNPRDAQSKRYRQRVMHKFKYYKDRFNKTLCTGCGRCIRACPVNLDIYQVVSEITK